MPWPVACNPSPGLIKKVTGLAGHPRAVKLVLLADRCRRSCGHRPKLDLGRPEIIA